MPFQFSARAQAALDLLQSGAVNPKLTVGNGEAILVPSSHEGAFYATSIDSCTCPDATYRKVVCKHQLAVRVLFTLTEGGN
jgi:SWIM zinc finger